MFIKPRLGCFDEQTSWIQEKLKQWSLPDEEQDCGLVSYAFNCFTSPSRWTWMDVGGVEVIALLLCHTLTAFCFTPIISVTHLVWALGVQLHKWDQEIHFWCSPSWTQQSSSSIKHQLFSLIRHSSPVTCTLQSEISCHSVHLGVEGEEYGVFLALGHMSVAIHSFLCQG